MELLLSNSDFYQKMNENILISFQFIGISLASFIMAPSYKDFVDGRILQAKLIIKSQTIYISFIKYKYQLNFIMEPIEQVEDKLLETAQIEGQNFQGTAELKGNFLTMDIVEFNRRCLYVMELNDEALQKQARKALAFTKIDFLFKELKENKKIYIDQEKGLIIPFQIKYKDQEFQFKAELPLVQRSFNSQQEKMLKLFEAIKKSNIKTRNQSQKYQRLKNEKQQLQNHKQSVEKILSLPVLIPFIGDETNQRIKSFKISENRKFIQKTNNYNQYTIYNHCRPLQKRGVFYYSVNLSLEYQIIIGICGKDIRSAINCLDSRIFMGFDILNRLLYINGQKIKIEVDLDKKQRKINTQIDMNQQLVSWSLNNAKIHTAKIPSELASIDIYPMISMRSRYSIQFLHNQ